MRMWGRHRVGSVASHEKTVGVKGRVEKLLPGPALSGRCTLSYPPCAGQARLQHTMQQAVQQTVY
jgi:hypothetical protein